MPGTASGAVHHIQSRSKMNGQTAKSPAFPRYTESVKFSSQSLKRA